MKQYETVRQFIESYYDDEAASDEFAALQSLRLEAERNHVPIISREAEAFLTILLRQIRPASILEVGTGVGYSSILFALLLDGVKVTTLEMIEKRYVAAHNNVKKFGLDSRIDIVEGDARTTLDDLDGKYDVIFIDSAKSHYRKFFDSAARMSARGATIICDNVLLNGRTVSDDFVESHRGKTSARRMREFIEYLKGYDGAESALFGVGDGLTVSKVKND